MARPTDIACSLRAVSGGNQCGRPAAPGAKRRARDRAEIDAGDPPRPAPSAALAIARDSMRATRRP